MKPISPTHIKEILDKGFAILPENYDSPAARQLMAAIGYQESAFAYRAQIGGPARGFWQFERGGGVFGVLRHKASAKEAREVCRILCVEPTADEVYQQLSKNDTLAACFARLLLYTDPRPLPSGKDEGWEYYFRNWRPGKPHPERWGICWDKATQVPL